MGMMDDVTNNAKKVAGDIGGKVEQSGLGEKASDFADKVLEGAEKAADKIPGEWDNKAVDWAKQQKDKLDGDK